MAANGGVVCITAGCSKPASLQCPTCLKMDIQGSFFCSQVRDNLFILVMALWRSSLSQDCFKGFWKDHKAVHKKSSAPKQPPPNYNPWPGFKFTGKLRPYPLVTEAQNVN